MTPEGKVKDGVKKVLAKYKSDLDSFWPVQTGYGDRHLDCIVCFCGRFITIETKAPGKSPTPLQKRRIQAVQRAGGIAVVVGGSRQTHSIEELDALLDGIRREVKNAADTGQHEAQSTWRA